MQFYDVVFEIFRGIHNTLNEILNFENELKIITFYILKSIFKWNKKCDIFANSGITEIRAVHSAGRVEQSRGWSSALCRALHRAQNPAPAIAPRTRAPCFDKNLKIDFF